MGSTTKTSPDSRHFQSVRQDALRSIDKHRGDARIQQTRRRQGVRRRAQPVAQLAGVDDEAQREDDEEQNVRVQGLRRAVGAAAALAQAVLLHQGRHGPDQRRRQARQQALHGHAPHSGLEQSGRQVLVGFGLQIQCRQQDRGRHQ